MNIGITYWSILKNTILTYSITITILAASFGIVYGLAIVQNNNSGSRYISFFISILISFINILISQVIRYLSKF
jgi:predicted Co/Zn/Cd cation transporter (cation efflux family)